MGKYYLFIKMCLIQPTKVGFVSVAPVFQAESDSWKLKRIESFEAEKVKTCLLKILNFLQVKVLKGVSDKTNWLVNYKPLLPITHSHHP